MARPSLLRRFAFCYAMACPGVLAPGQVIVLHSPNPAKRDYFGGAVHAARDVDGNGWPDLLIVSSEPHEGGNGRLYHLSVPAFAIVRSFVTPEPGAIESGLGPATSVADLDGDEVPDLVVGAHEHSGDSPIGAGRAHVFSGATGAHIRTLRAPVEWFAANFGSPPLDFGDIDLDGVGDFALGSSGTFSFRVYMFRGQDTEPTYTLTATTAEEGFGDRIAWVPDLNGDGRRDLVVGARRARIGPPGSARPGKVFVYSGSDGTPLYWLVSPNPQRVANFGFGVVGLEDFDGDGFGDFAASTQTDLPLEGDPAGPRGQVHIFSGATGGHLRTINSPGPSQSSNFGLSMAATPDLDGDGRQDLAVSAHSMVFPGNPSLSGGAHLFSGATGELLRTFRPPHPVQAGEFGRSLTALAFPTQTARGAVVIGEPSNFFPGAVYIYIYCRADTDADGQVNSRDISRFLTGWHTTRGMPAGSLPPPGVHGGDFNADGEVNVADISAFIAQWLETVSAGGCL